MQKLTEEQFKKKYGQSSIEQFSNTPQGYVSNVKNQVKGNLTEAFNSATSGNGNLANDFSAGANIAKNLTSAVLSPIAQAPGLKQIGEGFGKVGEFLVDTKVGNQVTDKLASTFSPQTLGTTSDLLETGLNVVGIKGSASSLVNNFNKVKNFTSQTKPVVQNAFDSVKENTISYPKEISDKITMGKINEQTQTILKEVPVEKFDRYVEAGMKAKKDPRALTPLEEAGETGATTNRIIKEDLNNIGKQKSATLNSVKDTKVPDVATPQLQKAQSLLQTKLTKAERAMVNEYVRELKALGRNPTAGSVDATIDKLYSTLYERGGVGAIPITTRVKAFINQSISEMNRNLKSVVDKKLGNSDYSTLNSAYSTKTKIFRAFNKALGEDGNRGGSLLKRFFSPQDGGVKKLFDAIKREYGIDLAQDATIAKFVMETLGDTRARSLLQLPPTSATGIIGKGLEFIEQKLTSPKRVFDKARGLTNQNEAKISNANAPVSNTSTRIISESVPQKPGLMKRIGDKLKEANNDQGGFIRNPLAPKQYSGVKIGGKSFKEIPEATKAEMTKIIDFLRGGDELRGTNKMLSSLMEKYNIPEGWSLQRVANAFENLIDKTKTR